jgi:hypothetical protein
MKRFALVGLSIVCLSLAATTSVKAETRTEQIAMSTGSIVNNAAVNKKLTPFTLVYLADGSLIFREGSQIAMKGGYKCRSESSITVKSFVGED